MKNFLIIIFVPPLRFLLERRWAAFVVDGIFFGLAWLFLLSIIGAAFAPFFWLLAMAYAWYDLATELRRKTLEEHAAMVGKAVAASVAGVSDA